MSSGKLTGARQKSLGDAAVDGLFAGVGAGIAMALYLVLAGLFAGENALAVLARFASGANASPIVGALTHLAVSGVYGALFAVLLRAMPFLNRAPRWLWGVAFGIILFTIAQAVVLPEFFCNLRNESWHAAN